MSWAEARLVPFSLPLSREVATARGTLRERRGWLLRLRDEAGREGHATAMPIDGFGGESFEASGRALVAALQAAEGGDEASLLDAAAPFAASAWACAHADLAARRAGRPLADFVAEGEGAPRAAVEVNALVAAGAIDALRAEVRRASACTVLKLKVGSDVDAALERVAAACEEMREGQRLRVDPNASWSEADASRALSMLAAYPIDYVEQPVADTGALARLRAASPVRVAADESASRAEGLRCVVAQRAADVVVMKPMLLGGPGAAVSLGAQAQRAGLYVVVTSLLDSALGVRAALAAALALPAAPLSCGLDTSALLAVDLVAPPPAAHAGRLAGWSEPGLGTQIDEAALRDCALEAERTWARS